MFHLITKPDCPYCVKAKQLLDAHDEVYGMHLYSEHPMIVKLMFKAGLKTVPQIWKDGMYIGGYEELVKWYEDDA